MKNKFFPLTWALLGWGCFLLAQPAVLQEARFKGTFGARFDAAGGTTTVTDGSPDNVVNYRARFYLNVNHLDLAGSNEFTLFSGRNGATNHFEVQIRGNGTGHTISVRARLDSGGTTFSPQIPLVRGWQAVDVRWRAGAGDGVVALTLDGIQVANLENLDNDQSSVSSVVLGYDAPTGGGDSGSFDVDDFDSRKLSNPGLLCLTPAEFLGFLAEWPSRDLLEEMDLLTKRCSD